MSPRRTRRSSSPARRAASASRSRCAPRATAPTSPSRRRPPSRTRSCRARSTPPPRRSRRPAARRCRSSSTSATRRRCRTAIDKTVAAFGGIDIVVNNASAISLTPTPQTDMKRFDLMHQINTRGTFMVSKYAIPHLEKAANPHILMLSPPLDMKREMVRAASRLLDGEIRHEPVRARPCGRAARRAASPSTRSGRAPPSRRARSRTCSAATRSCGRAARRRSWPTRPTRSSTSPRGASPASSSSTTSSSRGEGVTDFERYRVDPSVPLAPDFFVPDDTPPLSPSP